MGDDNYMFCVDGKFRGKDQPPVCLYNQMGYFNPIYNLNQDINDQYQYSYDERGNSLLFQFDGNNYPTRVSVPPNLVATINFDGNKSINVCGTYMKDYKGVDGSDCDAFEEAHLVGESSSINVSKIVDWPSFLNICENRSTTALQCQQFGLSNSDSDYQSGVITNIRVNNPFVYEYWFDKSGQGIVLFLFILFSIIVLFIILYASYVSYTRHNRRKKLKEKVKDDGLVITDEKKEINEYVKEDDDGKITKSPIRNEKNMTKVKNRINPEYSSPPKNAFFHENETAKLSTKPQKATISEF
jgi:hypothetical protein